SSLSGLRRIAGVISRACAKPSSPACLRSAIAPSLGPSPALAAGAAIPGAAGRACRCGVGAALSRRGAGAALSRRGARAATHAAPRHFLIERLRRRLQPALRLAQPLPVLFELLVAFVAVLLQRLVVSLLRAAAFVALPVERAADVLEDVAERAAALIALIALRHGRYRQQRAHGESDRQSLHRKFSIWYCRA